MKRPEKKTKGEIHIDLPEELVISIIARLPVKSIVRLKLVFREWKSLTGSSFFRDIYRSNSTPSSWSLLHGPVKSIAGSTLKEVKLDLPRESRHGNSSFVNGFTQNKDDKVKEIRVVACSDGLVLLRLEVEDTRIRYYVGNPVLPQWIQLPPPSPSVPPSFNPVFGDGFHDSGLVTRMHNGALLGYKVVRTHKRSFKLDKWSLEFEIFSSDTGEWSVIQVPCPDIGDFVFTLFMASNPVSLNGKLHWMDDARRVIVHDFFSHDDQVRVIRLPARMQGTVWSRHDISDISEPLIPPAICTTSQGCYVFIDSVLVKLVKRFNVTVWRLNSDSWNWEKAWETNLGYLGLGPSCVPMAVNCFDINIIYVWESDRKCFLAYNHRTGTKSYGARKPFSALYISSISHKEAAFCFGTGSCISQFVPSFHIVPT